MVTQEKTTLSMPDDLKRNARAKAILEGRSLSEVVRDLLRIWLDGQVELPPPESERNESSQAE